MTPVFAIRGDSDFDWETRFAGYRWGPESQLYLVRSRALHVSFGWLQRDPLLTYATNLYQYASSSPVMLTDPLGLYTLVEVLLIVVLIAIILASGIVIYRKIYRPVKYRRLYPGEDLTLKVQLKNLIGCHQMAGNNTLVANLEKNADSWLS